MILTLQRTKKTTDGVLGNITIDTNPFTCFTIENLNHEIAAGLYDIDFTLSPHFNKIMPHILVPGRTDIMIHPANWPYQLLGCVAVGDQEEPDAVDNSRITFNQLNSILDEQPGIKIQVNDIA